MIRAHLACGATPSIEQLAAGEQEHLREGFVRGEAWLVDGGDDAHAALGEHLEDVDEI